MKRLRALVAGALVAGALVAGALVTRAIVNFWLLFWLLMIVALAQK